MIDKLLLAAAGAGIVFYFSRALERYRRDQSVSSELGKLRAQAFAKILAALSSNHMILTQALEHRHTAQIPDTDALLLARSKEQLERLRDVVLEGIGLMDKPVGTLFSNYATAFGEFDLSEKALLEMTDEQIEAKLKIIRAMREQLAAYIPPIPRVD
ncbi:hypothetical protein [Corallococcus sp. AB038B]|uniref:hypothetical protein n=1 Tax=Corallococcus sp. AB038B TaxID=2316718 RepID=UPI0011C496C8|nr:hypothetical protein [Corallococcus sp. AB038B]